MGIPYISPDKNPDQVSDMLDDIPKHNIDKINWPEFSYAPEVDFSIAWNEKNIYLKYRVNEEVTGAVTLEDNGPVWKDSCVEFFVSPDRNNYYYNFEFNCLGVCLQGFGNSRHNREKASETELSGIIRKSSFPRKVLHESGIGNTWSLFIQIPASTLFRHPAFKFGKNSVTGNLYKCGDGLSRPHYLSWKPVQTPKPDFHRPEFFTLIEFVK